MTWNLPFSFRRIRSPLHRSGHRRPPSELQLLTTLKCNLKCSYCSLGVGDVLGSQTQVDYDIDQLAAFAGRHLAGKEVYVTFYGGEPTLNKAP